MKTYLLPSLVLGALFALVIHTAPAQAQATRTWVSGVGDDLNPCSRTAPCKTFAGAISKTAAGGEISVLDAGGYGAVTITKAMTINGEGANASVLSSSGSAITVSAAAGDKVILRNLQLNGAGGGTYGVYVQSGSVTVDKCLIYGFTTGFVGGMGVLVNASGTTNVDIRDTDITNTSHGVWVATSSGFAVATLDNVRINATPGYGVLGASSGAFVTINRSYITYAGIAAVYTSTGGATINVNDSVLTNNTIAVNASASGSTIRLNNTALFDNPTGISTAAGATVATGNNNRGAGNGGALTTNGTITSF
jgi:parallel beta helix pectate lyase-like protein